MTLWEQTTREDYLTGERDAPGKPAKVNGTNLRNPLEQHYLQVLGSPTQSSSELGDRAFRLVSDAIRKTSVKAIADKFSTVSFTTETLNAANINFPETTAQILANAAFEPSSDVVITNLASSKDDDLLVFWEQHSGVIGRLVKKFGQDSRTALNESFLSWHRTTQKRDKIEELVKALGLEVELSEQPDEDEIVADPSDVNE